MASYMFGLLVPGDIAGRVFNEIFEPDPDTARKQVAYESAAEGKRIRDRIRKSKNSGMI